MQETNRALLTQVSELKKDAELTEVRYSGEKKAIQRRMDENTSFYFD